MPQIAERQQGGRHPRERGPAEAQRPVTNAKAKARREQRQEAAQQQPAILPVEKNRRDILRQNDRRKIDGRENLRCKHEGSKAQAADKHGHADRGLQKGRKAARRGRCGGKSY